MNAEKAHEVAKWLNSIGEHTVKDAVPVKITIGKKQFFGAAYTWRTYYQVGMMACTHHGKTPGDECPPTKRFYLLGEEYKPKRKSAYTITGEQNEFYSGGYYHGEVTEYQPFGDHWDLHEWNVDHTVDWGEDNAPWPRIPVVVERL